MYPRTSHPKLDNTRGKDQFTATETSCPTTFDRCAGYLTSPADLNIEDTGDGAYDLSSLTDKTRTSNHLQMSLH